MRISAFLFILFSVVATNSAFAQLTKIVHQTFEADSAQVIELDLVGDYEIEYWHGNNILVETNIALTGCSPAILEHFLEVEKRYDLNGNLRATTLVIESNNKVRKPVKTKTMECYEMILHKLYIPDRFAELSATSFQRKNEEE